MQHAFDLHRGHGRAFDRTQHDASQCVADGGAESALERLRPEHPVFIGERTGIARQTFRFLKTSPKHVFLLSAMWLDPGSLSGQLRSKPGKADLARIVAKKTRW